MTDHNDLSGIERDLQAGRPTPAPLFLDRMVAAVHASPIARVPSPWRLRLAFVLALLGLAAVAALCGVSDAANAAKGTSTKVQNAVSHSHHSGKGDEHKGGKGDKGGHHGNGGGDHGGSGHHGDDQEICEHHHHTRHVTHHDASTLVAQGDAQYGPCPVP